MLTLTKFGKVCRKLRIDNDHKIKDMARILKVSEAYVSAVELGKRNIPKDWVSKLTKEYKLNPEQEVELLSAKEQSLQEGLKGYK